jgi:hypothetical protein
LFDSSGLGNNGTWNGTSGGSQTAVGTCNTASTAWGNGATGKFNNSLNFDGTDDYVTMGSQSTLNFASSFSTSAWIKTSTTGTRMYILSKGNAAGSNFGYDLEVGLNAIGTCTANNRALFILYNTSNGSYISACGNTTITDGSWHHVMGVWDAPSTTIYIYIDGKLQGSTTSSAGGTQVTASTAAFEVGRRGDATGYFNGQIDDVRIYNYALSATQVKNVYNGGSAVNYGPSTGSP